jgi:DNA polymerase III subunit gamma/tau
LAFDTKYRPRGFDGVIGQENSVKVLRQFVKSGTGFHQSYLFCGSHGSGKTTMGRILARALLCEKPINGDPCDECVSCKSILERGTSECFTEFDAATNSGKDDVKKITEAVSFDTFSGKRRIYLVDEAHRLSPAALDALLKPMEDTVAGSDDKLLVCLFCTTEPEKMKATIFSRCAPAFVIRRVSPDGIADRLAYVCEQEGITYERAALVLIAEAVECHIRDALKSVEGVSMLGTVSVDNVKAYLRLNANSVYLRVLLYLGKDLGKVLEPVQELQEMVSPATAYERLSELAMLAYRVFLGVGKPPSYWSEKHVAALGKVHEVFLVQVAQALSTKPGHPTYAMLECDLATLHFQRAGGTVATPTVSPKVLLVPAVSTPTVSESPPVKEVVQAGRVEQSREQTPVAVTNPATASPAPPVPPAPVAGVTRAGVYVDPRAVNKHREANPVQAGLPPIEPSKFREGLARLISEMAVDGRGPRSTG